MIRENKDALEYFYTLIDQAEAVFCDDLMMENTPFSEYAVKFPEGEERKEEKSESISDCHKCPLWQNRRENTYFNPEKAKVVFILSKLETPDSVFSDQSEALFEKEMNVLSLSRSNRAVIPLINCPVAAFDGRYASMCKGFLKERIEALDPSLIVIMGSECARFLTKMNVPFENMRASVRSFRFLSRKTFITYSPQELIGDRMLRRPVFEDLKKIKESLS